MHPMRRRGLPSCEVYPALSISYVEEIEVARWQDKAMSALHDDLVGSLATMVGGVAWGYWKPHPLLPGKVVKDHGVIVKHQ